ncbi:MAG: SDR family oxidoreductase [Bryobacterales bacterium]|nr:SDR family oxidoreductase [Bryobacterales bacterium]
MMQFLAGQVAVVTGGTRGIGREIVRQLAEAGASVVFCGTDPGATAAAVQELSAGGAKVAGRVCDVRNRDQVKALFDYAAEQFGGVDIVVNNAGVGVFKPMRELSVDDWHRVIDINLTGVFHCSQEALLHFGTRGGYVFQIGSLAGKNPFAGGAAYNASKFGLNGFSEAMLLDHRYDNVRVTTICPGSVDTDFSPRTARASWKIQPEDVAAIVLALLQMPPRTLVSYVEVRPSQPKKN